jgi:hypothetical protein
MIGFPLKIAGLIVMRLRRLSPWLTMGNILRKDQPAASTYSADARLRHAQTVFLDEDDSRNVLTGAAGNDWFFFDRDSDRVTDLRDEAFANDLDWILGLE